MDKFPTFGLPFFYRVVFPGVVFALACSFVLTRARDRVGFPVSESVLGFVAVSLGAGLLIAAMDSAIYEFYEGRRGWPNRLRSRLTSRLATQVKTLHERALDKDDPAFAEKWEELRDFPVDKSGWRTAVMPTLLGNILYTYEDYPLSRHGYDAVFYWPRLWLQLPKDMREEVDSAWSVADGWLYASAALALSGVIHGISATVDAALILSQGVGLVFHTLTGCFAGGLFAFALLAFAYVPYWISLPAHRRNGELFKSLFDLNWQTLDKLKVSPSRERAHAVFQALQYNDDEGLRRLRRKRKWWRF
ncbi:MAG TPA: hypothetical protein VFM93_14585 [Candidatus Limnocylindria bacterium]|nr:hypothetical protein [Candidatus Limnocylindria bacterium]